MRDFSLDRERMVRDQLERRGIKNQAVLASMRNIPRHLFVSMEYQSEAYADHPLPIGNGQTISQPYIVALMTELLQPIKTNRILEIGTGSGYQAAILSFIVAEVHSIDRHAGLVFQARTLLSQIHIENVHLHTGDGSLGLPEFAPYDGILITAAAPEIPDCILHQLGVGGKLVAPVGGRYHQILERWVKVSDDAYEKDKGIPVSFVPLLGKYGWSETEW